MKGTLLTALAGLALMTLSTASKYWDAYQADRAIGEIRAKVERIDVEVEETVKSANVDDSPKPIDRKRVVQLQTELERLRSELTQISGPSNTPQGLGKMRGIATILGALLVFVSVVDIVRNRRPNANHT